MIKIKFIKEGNKVIAYDDNMIVGECQFTEFYDTWNIINTVVKFEYRNLGVAKKMVECIVNHAKKDNKSIKADCSYAKKIISKI